MIPYYQLHDTGPSLTKTLSEHLPRHCGSRGWISPRKLGPALGLSCQSASRWLIDNKVPPQRIASLIKLPGSTLTKEMLLEFVDFGE